MDHGRGIRQRRRPAPPRDREAAAASLRYPVFPLAHARLDAIGAAQGRTAGSGDDEPRLPLDVAFAGGHRIALETEAVVKRESLLNGVASLAIILPLLYLVFRSLWLIVCGALPSTASLVVALGVLGLTGATLSAAATGAAAMLFGLGIDGVVLIYVAHRLALSHGMSVAESVGSLGGPSASMLLGMLTTAATFYGLVFVDFPSLQQLGLVIGHSMVACGLLTLVLIPALLPKRPPRGPVRALTWPALASWITRLEGRCSPVLSRRQWRSARRHSGFTWTPRSSACDRRRQRVVRAVRARDVRTAERCFVARTGSSARAAPPGERAYGRPSARGLPAADHRRASALLPSDAAQERSRARFALRRRRRQPSRQPWRAGVRRGISNGNGRSFQ